MRLGENFRSWEGSIRNPQGYALLLENGYLPATLDKFRCLTVDKNKEEFDTFSCSHCQRHVHVRAKEDPANIGGLCKSCMRLICPGCIGKTCRPWAEKLLQQEQRAQALRSYGF